MPFSLKAAKGLIIIRLVVMTVIMLLMAYFISTTVEAEGFFLVIKRTLFRRFDIDLTEGSAYNLGLLAGSLTLPLAAMVAQLILIRAKKRYTMLLLISLLEIVLAMSRAAFPLVGLIIFVLLLLPSSRDVFKEEVTAKRREEILDDMEF